MLGKVCSECGREVYKRREDIEETILTDVSKLEEFKRGSIYADIMNELHLRIDETNRCLDDVTLQFTGRQHDIFRGGKKILMDMLRIVDDIIDNKNDPMVDHIVANEDSES